jgi:hypothetical protein
VKPRVRRSPDPSAAREPATVVAPAVRTGNGGRLRGVACRAGARPARRGDREAGTGRYFCYYVDANGRQHFNFIQQIWLRPQVEMAVTSIMTVALETLAVNLLTQVTRDRNCPAAVGVTSRRVMQLARLFCAECLLSAHSDGWVMPRVSVKSWFAAHIRARRRGPR